MSKAEKMRVVPLEVVREFMEKKGGERVYMYDINKREIVNMSDLESKTIEVTNDGKKKN